MRGASNLSDAGRSRWAHILCLLVAPVALPQSWAWTSHGQQPRISHGQSSHSSLLQASSVGSELDVMEGTQTFERWFSSVPGASCSPDVSHFDFGNLRGIQLTPEGKERWEAVGGRGLELMKVPRTIVLSSDFSQTDWDADLAQKLWMECTKGQSSSVAGYVALLTRGWTPADLPQLPPSTAPDALRHWSDDEKSLLSDSDAGQTLLSLLEQQNELWEQKFSKINGMTYDQFEWAMEVVHSRAFCGDFGIGSSFIPPILTVAVPLVAAAAGYQYFTQTVFPEDTVLLGLGLMAVFPALFIFFQQSPPVAVLLPMIDSINHLEEADSQIEYSPLSEAFTLSVGNNCAAAENEKTQLFISYGKKKNTELLLNYGFLRGVSSAGNSASRRKALAKAYLS